MDRARHLPIRISILVASLLMASCAATPPGGPGTSAPTPSTLSATTQADKSAATPIPATTSRPQEACAPFLTGAPCATYDSVAASSHGKALAWAAAGTVKVQLTSVKGTLQLSVRTPCSPLSAPVAIKANILTVAGKIATGAEGCVGAAGDQQVWVQEFLKRPIAMTYSNGTLSWVSGADALSFKTE